MECLYQTDQFISNLNPENKKDKSSSSSPPASCPRISTPSSATATTSSSSSLPLPLSKVQIDPYDYSNSPTTTNKKQNQQPSYRERIAIMELACIDKQVAQYNALSSSSSLLPLQVPMPLRSATTSSGDDEEEYHDLISPSSTNDTAYTYDNHNHNDDNDVHDETKQQETKPPATSTATKTTTTTTTKSTTKKMNNDIHQIQSQLYEIDLEMNYHKEDVQVKDDIQSIMELYIMDQHIDKNPQQHQHPHQCTSTAFVTKQEEMIFESLYNMDQKVNNKNSTTATTSTATSTDTDTDTSNDLLFIDPINELIMREYGIIESPTCKIKCWDVRDIIDLLLTDRFVDGCSRSSTSTTTSSSSTMDGENSDSIMKTLYHIDNEIDHMTLKIVDQKEMECVLDLYHIDQEVEGKKQQQQQQTSNNDNDNDDKDKNNNLIHGKNMNGNAGIDTLPKDIADLYCIDLQVEGRTDTIEKQDECTAILELYNIDCEVDGARYRAYHNDEKNDMILKELYVMDQIVDGNGNGNSGGKGEQEEDQQPVVEFVDYITTPLMNQYVIQSDMLKDSDTNIIELFDLHLTDIEVNGHNAYQDAMDDIEPLYMVDLEVCAVATYGKFKDTMENMYELLKVDMDIEMMKLGQQQGGNKKQQDVPTKTISYKPCDRDIEIDSILSLHESDLQVSEMKSDVSFSELDTSNYRDLYMMDALVDNHPVDEDESLRDPFTKSLLFQYVQESRKAASCYDHDIRDLLDIISNDMQVGAAASQKRALDDEQQVIPLYHVDAEIEQMKSRDADSDQPERNDKPCEKASVEKVDVTRDIPPTTDIKMEAPLSPKKRSIFSQKEMKNCEAKVTQLEENDKTCEKAPVDKANVTSDMTQTASIKTEAPPSPKKRSIFSQREKKAAVHAKTYLKK